MYSTQGIKDAAQTWREQNGATMFPIYAVITKTKARVWHFTLFMLPFGQYTPHYISERVAIDTRRSYCEARNTLTISRRITTLDKAQWLESLMREVYGENIMLVPIYHDNN